MKFRRKFQDPPNVEYENEKHVAFRVVKNDAGYDVLPLLFLLSDGFLLSFFVEGTCRT